MDIDELRKAIMDYYGTAKEGPFPQATIDLIDVENMSDGELIKYAKKKGFISKDYDEEDYER